MNNACSSNTYVIRIVKTIIEQFSIECRKAQNKVITLANYNRRTQFSIECRKTKNKVVSLANYNRCTKCNEPISTRNKYM